jgi:hypothetical protein
VTPFYQYEFISPAPLYARVKEELNSWFDTGMADDLLFPLWVDDCLRKLGKGSYPIRHQVLVLDDFQSPLPENFLSVREAWLCVEADMAYRQPSSVYYVGKEWAYNLSNTDCDPAPEGCVDVYYKGTRELLMRFSKQYLLTPGTVAVRENCALDCANFGQTGPDKFDIRDGKFQTNFRSGTVYLNYYAQETDDCQNQLIPDNVRIFTYLEKYLKYKTWQKLADNSSDEGAQRRLDGKASEAKHEADEALILAFTEIKKQTLEQKARALKRQNQRLNRFNIR